MAAESDNLDARMEAIRLKNEELEKKHKEIMEDELLAKRENATVDVNSGRAISKAHPYDNVELDFDVKETDKELSRNPDFKPKNRRPLPRKDLLDEIPPDPVNFLREDGDDTAKVEPSQNQRQPINRNRNYNNRNRQDRPRPGHNEHDEPVTGDSPPRARNSTQRPRYPPQQQNRSPQDGDAPRRPTHPQQLRSERRSAPVPSDDFNGQQHQGQAGQQPNRQRRPNNRPPNREVDRNNITVQITDEMRSVKLKSSEKTFGTGRVGRQHSHPDDIGKFTVDTFNPEMSSEPREDRSPHDRPRNRNPRNNPNRRNQKPREFTHPTLDNIVITKANVQDRLMKIAKDPAPTAFGDASNGN